MGGGPRGVKYEMVLNTEGMENDFPRSVYQAVRVNLYEGRWLYLQPF